MRKLSFLFLFLPLLSYSQIKKNGGRKIYTHKDKFGGLYYTYKPNKYDTLDSKNKLFDYNLDNKKKNSKYNILISCGLYNWNLDYRSTYFYIRCQPISISKSINSHIIPNVEFLLKANSFYFGYGIRNFYIPKTGTFEFSNIDYKYYRPSYIYGGLQLLKFQKFSAILGAKYYITNNKSYFEYDNVINYVPLNKFTFDFRINYKNFSIGVESPPSPFYIQNYSFYINYNIFNYKNYINKH